MPLPSDSCHPQRMKVATESRRVVRLWWRYSRQEHAAVSSPYPVLGQLQAAQKSYGKVQALAGVDLDVRAGELLALLGPNGAGKTTAIALLLGLQRADAGQATLFGLDPQRLAARRRV